MKYIIIFLVLVLALSLMIFAAPKTSVNACLSVANTFNKIAFRIDPREAIMSPNRKTRFDGVNFNLSTEKDFMISHCSFGDNFNIKKARNIKINQSTIGHYAYIKGDSIKIDSLSKYVKESVRIKSF